MGGDSQYCLREVAYSDLNAQLFMNFPLWFFIIEYKPRNINPC